MAELRTRIILRNDSSANWLTNEAVVLLKGEIGIEFNPEAAVEGSKALLKIGDGVHTWAELPYFGGESLEADGKSVSISDGIIKLFGFDVAEVGAQPSKGENGELIWAIPEVTAEDLNTTVEEIVNSIGTPAEGETPATGIYAELGTIEDAVETLQTKVDNKANAEDVYTKTEVDGLVSGVYHYKGTVNSYVDLPTENLTIGDTYNIINAYADQNIKAGDNVAWNGTAWDVLAGVIDLSAYATIEALADKVDKVDGYRLITENEAEKLEKLVLGDDGSVSVSGTIAAGNVDGLADWITTRASTLEGLTENNLTDALLEKLNGVEIGAEVNLIDIIQVNGVALNVTSKTVSIMTSDVVKASDEVTVAEDGTLGIGTISTDKLVQGSDVLILNGGSAQ